MVPPPPAPEEMTDEQDFVGNVETDDEIPTPEVLRALENHTVLDSAGRTHPFKSLYSGTNVARRILVIFVRHFFCGVSRPVPSSIGLATKNHPHATHGSPDL
ncbi:hypothetical protein F5Y14DRAFT_453187 [Nemania sp. NC0429]|nr:hypothetical protein F5Y14DRAFT_453187 [Nemania sp. NC0429]